MRELLKDVSLHVTEQGTDSFNVAGRGEMHLSILMETMRREGYEFAVSTPRVLTKQIDGKLCEPIERMVCDVPDGTMGAVIEKIGQRKGDLVSMTPVGSRYRLEFLVPSRGLFGYRNEFLTDTRGEGIMSSVLDSYAPMKGEITRRLTGSLIAFETGEEKERLNPPDKPGKSVICKRTENFSAGSTRCRPRFILWEHTHVFHGRSGR